MRLIQQRIRRRAAIAAETSFAHPRDCRNYSTLRIDAPHNIIAHLHKKHIPIPIEPHLVRLIQRCDQSRSAIAAPSLLTAARHRRNRSASIDLPNAMIPHITEEQLRARPHTQSIRIIQVCFNRRPAISRKSGFASSRDCFDFQFRPAGPKPRHKNQQDENAKELHA
jgi:hypothetical protein